jgi:hypothetical protein
MMDMCEQICGDDAECIRECHGESLREISKFFLKLDINRTSPDQLDFMVKDFKSRLRYERESRRARD